MRSLNWSSCARTLPPGTSLAPSRAAMSRKAFGHLRARAGEACERDRAMAVLERKLDRHTEGIAVLRAMAVSAQPARRRLVECGQEFGRTEAVKALGRLVVHEAPRQHPGIVPIVAGGEPVARRGTLGRRFRRETGAQQG